MGRNFGRSDPETQRYTHTHIHIHIKAQSILLRFYMYIAKYKFHQLEFSIRVYLYFINEYEDIFIGHNFCREMPQTLDMD